jgi:hypothetical protein
MKTNHSLTRLVLALTQSKWLQSAALTLATVVVLAGITGCQPHH